MQIKTDGIVIKQQKINDNDRYLTILTRDSGVIRAYANNANGIKSPMCSSTSLMCYSDFVINESKGNFRVFSADLKRAFFGIGRDLKKVALATYFFEITSVIGVPDAYCEQLLRLLLNTLHFLEEGLKDEFILKSIFEIRALMICGFAPQVASCCGCGEYTDENMHFSMKSGELICGECYHDYPEKSSAVTVKPQVLQALRYLVFSDIKDIYRLMLPSSTAAELTALSEEYCAFQLDRRFDTLKFFYSIV